MKLASFMKKTSIAAFPVMVLCLCCCLTGCGGGGNNSGKTPGDNPGDNNPVPLTSPQSVSITGLDGKLDLKWTHIAAALGIEATYEVWYSTENNAEDAIMSAQGVAPFTGSVLCSVEITGLTNGVPYYVWVKAVFGSLGAAPFSPSFRGVPVPVPETPTGVTVTAGENLLEINWDLMTSTYSYDVLYSDEPTGDNGRTVTVADPAIVISTFKDAPMENEKTYYIWVRAVNTNGPSDFSEPVTGVPVAAVEPPQAPGYLTVTSGNQSLSVTWDSVPGATRYEIWCNTVDDSASAELCGEATSRIPNVITRITGLTNHTPYFTWVTALNSLGTSDFSPAGTGTPAPKDPIVYDDMDFILGEATAEFIDAEVLPYAGFASNNGNRISGTSQDSLTRVKETPLGNLFTDGAAWYAKNVMDEPVDFVFITGSFIENLISRGPISVRNLLTATANRDDTFTFVTLKGSDVIELFDDAAYVGHTGARTGDMAAVGGPPSTTYWAIVSEDVSYTIQYAELPEDIDLDAKFPIEEMQPYIRGVIKPGTLKISGLAVDPNKEYRIATTDNLAAGAYYVTFPVSGYNKKETSTPFWHGVAEYIYEHEIVSPSIPANNDECRITLEGGVWLGALNENICNFRNHRP